jgi:diguanylate cyclase (GGDEF)-like protein
MSLIRLFTIQILGLFVVLAIGSGALVVYSLNQGFKKESAKIRKTLIAEQKALLKEEVYRALDYVRVEHSRIVRFAKEELLRESLQLHAMLESSYFSLDRQTLSLEYINAFLIQIVRAYNAHSAMEFTITSTEGIGVFHPSNPHYQGVDLRDLRDHQQTRVVNEEVHMVAISDEGYLSTFWEDEGKVRQKVTFVKKFDAKAWYFTASIYLDEFSKRIDQDLFEHLANRRFGTGEEGYFFINSLKGELIVSNGKVFNPRPNIWDTEDPNGVNVVQQNSRIAQESAEGGFSEYTWETLSGDLSPKISFVAKIPNRDMFIGAGLSVDYIDTIIAKQREQLKGDITERIIMIVALFLFATLMLSLSMAYLAKRTKKNVQLFFKTFETAAHEHTEIAQEKITFSEFHLLANGANKLIKELKRQQKEAYYSASHDYLTDLPNRLLLGDRLEQAINIAKRTGGKIAVVFMDLDHFKRINDTMGHDIGDTVLIHVAKRLKKVIRETDTLARIGGDEFIFILTNIIKDEVVYELIRRMIRSVNEPLHVNDHTLSIGCSLGIAFYPDDGESGDVLSKNADIAMYEAKAKGRNNFQCFNATMESNLHHLLQLENEILRGIRESEFELYYQPKVKTDEGVIVGAEVLLRWNHPTRGVLSPDAFVGIAEESGLIYPLGEWVLEPAFDQLARWQKRGWSLSLAINLSVKQIENPHFIDTVKTLLARHAVSPALVELEITESFSVGSEKNIEALHHLKALGVSLAIDDFGTGYSSLSYLNKLPIDTIKIDRSFITNMLENEDQLALVKIILQTAKILDLEVVAEGVESEEELAMLQHLACPYFQGFYFSKPITLPRFNSLAIHAH